MNAPKLTVKCSVDNCSFNKSRICNAKSLEVNAVGDGFAQNPDGTYCSTFKNNQ